MSEKEEAAFASMKREENLRPGRHGEAIREFINGTSRLHSMTKESLLNNLDHALRAAKNAALEEAARAWDEEMRGDNEPLMPDYFSRWLRQRAKVPRE